MIVSYDQDKRQEAPVSIALNTTEPDRDDEAIAQRLEALKANLAAGFTMMPDMVRGDPTLSRTAKLVYEQLLSYMRQRDFCWPSQQRIADDLGTVSRRTVIRAIRELYERGFIEKWRRGLNRTNVYFINPLDFTRSFKLRTGPILVSCGKCQIDTPGSDTPAPLVVPESHPKQTNQKENQQNQIPSNHSTAESERAIGNETTNQAASPKRNETPLPGNSPTPSPETKPKPRRKPIPDFIDAMVTDFAVQLGDRPASIKSSITRATKIYFTCLAVYEQFQDDPEGLFCEMLYQARAGALSVTTVKHKGGRHGNRHNRMPLFLSLLERMCEFTPEELAYLKSDAPLLL